MKILMLGNSLTTANHMPDMLGKLLDAEVTVHARGGARLAEQLNLNTKLGAKTGLALREEHFDYVILQEMSHGPATAAQRYLDSVRSLTELVRRADAEPVIYATWAFRPGCEKLQSIGMKAEEMHRAMQETFRKASEENDLIIANAGEAFRSLAFTEELYALDGVHPSEAGSRIAAKVIADVIVEYDRDGLKIFDGKRVRITDIDGNVFEGVCDWFPSGFGEAELGTAEEGLQIEDMVFFESTIMGVTIR